MPSKDESRTVDSICVTGEDKEIVKSYILIKLSHRVVFRSFALIQIPCLQWYGYLMATT